jgi:N-acetyl-1-D-myo-inositol-2-amino-2-deoxy-alpha-D-glucopyranoside deacetylase
MTTLLLVHAHPDDESILTGGVMLHAHRDGHRVVLVTATRGEEGDVHNMDGADARPRLGAIRSDELRAACAILGVDRHEFLGYRDSGTTGATSNAHPNAFAAAPLCESAERVAVLLREERPEVVVTYTADGTYANPDHRMAHATTLAARETLAGEGWVPRKLYLNAVPRSFVRDIVEVARAAGIELPGELAQVQGIPDEEITAEVDVSDVLDRKLAACVAHLSQMHPGLALAAMAAELFEAAFGVERFVLAQGGAGQAVPERNLFAGLN